MFVNMTTLKEARRRRDCGFRHAFADVDIEAAQKLSSCGGEIMKSHFKNPLTACRAHRPILDELFRILPDEGIESRAKVLKAASWTAALI
ncbi:hypothetical protein B5V03_28565 [Bradyrhizobium betae]|uniref:Uncharacterized protein n=1 Tax=Bradyrhizobium betae TaxID=244734 RepID=A0A4Q1UQX6_9BRAD|nr:hypothetical protein B5V03_28565 [Bradyrhizobium betae]